MKTSQKDFEALANTIPQLAWMTTPDGEVYWCNDRFYHYTGLTSEVLSQKSWASIHKPNQYEELKESWAASIANGTLWERLMPLKGRDNQFKWFMVRCLPVRGENGTIIRWVGTSTDVNEQVKYQRQLDDTLNAMSDTFLAIASDWTISQVNSVLLRETKLARKEIIGRDFRDVFLASIEAQKSKYWTEYHRLMKDRVPVSFEEYYAPFDMWTAVRAFPTSEGGFTIFSSDITKKKKIEQDMREAQKFAERANEMKSELLVKISNDIRGPIGVILEEAERLRDPKFPDESKKATLDKLVLIAEQLAFTINDLKMRN